MPKEVKQYKIVSFKNVKNLGSDDPTIGNLEGEGSTFGNKDLGGDIIVKGAFRKTVKENNGKFPVLLDHDPRQLSGFTTAKETKTGLFNRIQLRLISDNVKQRFEVAKDFIQNEMKMGLSIGFFPIKVSFDDKRPDVRFIHEIKLIEISIVAFPMNELAGISAAKALDDLIKNAPNVDEACAIVYKHLQSSGYDESKINAALRAIVSKAAANQDDPLQLKQSLNGLLASIQS